MVPLLLTSSLRAPANRALQRKRQPSCDGTSRMMREYQVRICAAARCPSGVKSRKAHRDHISSVMHPKADVIGEWGRFGFVP
jgi:hypothetical protein